MKSWSTRVLAPLALAAIFPSAAGAEDWPRWRGPNGDGVWHAPELPQRWPDEGLPVAWKKPLGGGYSGIAAGGGRVYTMDRQTHPREVERLLCFDAKSGDLLWSAEYPVAYNKLDYGNGPRSTPTLHDGHVYTLGAVGHLRSTDAATGKQLWLIDLVAKAGAKIPEWGLAASPVIWNELVIVHPGGNPSGCIMAFHRRTGQEVWRCGDDPAGYATPILIQHAGREQLICWTPLHVLGLDPATGNQYWSTAYKVTYGVSIATPLFRDGIVFVSGYWEGSKAIRLGDRPQQAELLWENNRHLRGIMSPPIYRDGLVYSLDKQYGLTCFELATGKKLWDDGNRLTPRGRNPQANLVWLGETDRTIVLNSDGELILARLTSQGYQEQSRVKIIGPTWAHPAFAGHRVYARNDSELVVVELPIGRPPREGEVQALRRSVQRGQP